MTTKYTPYIKSHCVPVIDENQLNSKIASEDWTNLNIWNGSELDDAVVNKYLLIVSLLEVNKYPDDLSSINAQIQNNMTLQNFNFSNNNNYIQYKKYSIGQHSFTVVTKFNYVDYLINGVNYNDNTIRGDEYIKNLITIEPLADIVFGSYVNSIPAISLLSKANNNTSLLLLLNPVEVILQNATLDGLGKKIRVIEHNPEVNKFPGVLTLFDGTTKSFVEFADETPSKVDLVRYHLDNDNNCFNTYLSYAVYTIFGSTADDCATLLDLPTTGIKIPNTLNDIDNARWCYYILSNGISTSKISNYKANYIDYDHGIMALQSQDDEYLLIIFDKFMAEDILNEPFSFVTISSANSFKILSQVQENNQSILDTIQTTLNITDDVNTKVIIYSFGVRVYSLLYDFNTKFSNIKPIVYAEGLANVTQGFTSFDHNYNIDSSLSANIYQDSIVDTKTVYNTPDILDSIMVDRLYDMTLTEAQLKCVHSIYAYSLISQS